MSLGRRYCHDGGAGDPPSEGSTRLDIISALQDAESAAAAAGVDIRVVHDIADTRAGEALMMRVWNTDRSGVPLSASTMRALAHAGNYVAAAFAREDPARMVGCTIGFFGPPDAGTMHSHVAAVDGSRAGGGVGVAMKLHQRAWCLERGVERMTWTFDPAISRNAYFNLHKLGVVAREYLEDFYGPLDDGRNVGSPSDRLFVEWGLAAPFPPPRRPLPAGPKAGAPESVQRRHPSLQRVLRVGPTNAPVVVDPDPEATVLEVGLLRDIEALRRDDPALAAEWRVAVRTVLAPLVTSPDWDITGFSREGGYAAEKRS